MISNTFTKETPRVPTTTSRWRRWRSLLAATFVTLAMGCASAPLDDDAADDPIGAESETSQEALTQAFTGTLTATGTYWASHKFTVDADSTIDVSLDWVDPASDFHVYLYDATGKVVRHANGSTNKPERVTYEGAAGAYSIGVKCAKGGGRYTASVDVTPKYVEHVFSGATNATNASWKTFDFPAEAGERIDARLDWDNAAADLNVYLYDPSGKVVAYENSTTAKPSVTSTTANATGTWRVALKCRSSSANFTVVVRRSPASSPPPPPPPEPPPPPAPRFPGDPGPGKIVMGAAMANQTASTFDATNAAIGRKFSASRLYYGSNINWGNVDSHIAAGRMPAVSFKNESRTLANIAAGREDAWIDAIGAQIKARAPVPFWMTFFHEPEDNYPTAPEATEFRAASRRIVQRWRQLGVTNFTYVADYFMTDWSFVAASGRDWRWWYPDWKGTTAAGSSKDAPNPADFYSGSSSVVDVIGLDVYNFWEIGMAESRWRSFQSHADQALSRMRGLQKPYAVGEWGSMAYQVNGVVDAARTRAWFIDAYDYMVSRNFVGAMYWNNDFDVSAWDCRLEFHDPGKVRLQAMNEIMGRATTVVPTW